MNSPPTMMSSTFARRRCPAFSALTSSALVTIPGFIDLIASVARIVRSSAFARVLAPDSSETSTAVRAAWTDARRSTASLVKFPRTNRRSMPRCRAAHSWNASGSISFTSTMRALPRPAMRASPSSIPSVFRFHPQTTMWSRSFACCKPFPSRILRSTKMLAMVPESTAVTATLAKMSRMPSRRPAVVTG